MKTLYFDCFSGISGDMILGALVDAGLDIEVLKTELAKLKLTGYEIRADKVVKKGITGTKVEVTVTGEQKHRHLKDILKIIDESELKPDVKNISRKIFTNLAAAEAKVHDTEIDKVHFHEVGAVDSIVDIVGAVIGLKELGVENVYASRVHTGSGFVDCQHGRMPVPAPATTELLRDIPVYSMGVESELTTPTGAAVLKSLALAFGPMPAMKIIGVGYGAGSKEFAELPNLLRVYLGEVNLDRFENDEVALLETNLDDMNPEFFEYVTEKLMAEGALDVFTVPIIMKKSRPGAILNVLCEPDRIEKLLPIIFAETTTLGVRLHRVGRCKLARKIIEVETKYGMVRVKIGQTVGDNPLIRNITPEYEDCKKIAREKNIPLKNVFDEIKRVAVSKLTQENL
ncbi:MAG: nickel pincer cofactor biosynthesis protein LarC [Candidatus Zixiibacteriota bacterium]